MDAVEQSAEACETDKVMKDSLLLLAFQIAAFWSVWQWYITRLILSSEERWGLLALAVAALFIVKRKATGDDVGSLFLPTVLMLFYVCAYPFAPPLARACLAMTILGCTLSRLRFGTCAHPGIIGLLLLSLPVIPSLQFYGGYPLRVLVAKVAAPVLRMNGFAVIQEGTCLNWMGQLIWVDAPCSGVRMLWAGLFLACALVCAYGLRFWKASGVIAMSFVLIIIGNIMRAVALFYTEAGILPLPAWTHEAIGVVIFAFTGILILIVTNTIERGRRCDAI